MKRCTKCKTEKKESEFRQDEATKDGLQPHCKQCVAVSNKSRYENHIHTKTQEIKIQL
jgi:hypothetical protein